MEAARLYIVATPIGNLEDMTFRGVRILRESAWIACEDTRTTRKLLDHYEIRTPLVSYHDFNERERAGELVARLQRQEQGALVSDAGMPLVSDPGFRLVRAAIDAGMTVQPVPGASAVIAGLAVAGLPTDAFRFGGFLPEKQGKRRNELEAMAHETATLVYYEAPHRILAALEDIEAVLGPRPMAVGRELTKLHEETLRGTPGEIRAILAGRDQVRGEITLLIGKGPEAPADDTPLEVALERKLALGLSRMDAMKELARERGVSKREIYQRLERG